MTPISSHRIVGAGALALLAFFTGCSTTATTNPPSGKIIVIDGNQEVTLPPAVGSHMVRHVKISQVNEQGINPTRVGVIDETTDTRMPPTTFGTPMGDRMGGGGP
jgi:hypothetical protein